MAYIDKYGVEFSDDRLVLKKCPKEFQGRYVIPDGVASIGECAFLWCTSLTSIEIPNSVTSIGEDAFGHCSGLVNVPIPNSVKIIGKYAFAHCDRLTRLVIPNNVTCIEGDAFWGCSGLTNVVIPNSITSIEEGTFSGCSNLTSVTIPNSITSIGKSAFSHCSGLTSINIPDSVISIEEGAFFYCSHLKSVEIGSGVKSIGNGAFEYCRVLKNVSIPNNVISIGNRAFHSVVSIFYYGEAIGSPWGAQKMNVNIGKENAKEEECRKLVEKRKHEQEQIANENWRIIFAITAFLLLIGCLPLPIGYYTFLRIVVFISCGIIIWNDLEEGFNWSNISMGLIALIFNPIIPIYLHDKSVWVVIDAIAALYFAIKAYKLYE